MKKIGQLNEQELEEYNSGNNNIVSKYLNEAVGKYMLPKSRKKYIANKKILDKMEKDLQKATNNLVKELEDIVKEEYDEILSNITGKQEQHRAKIKIGEELEEMFYDTNSKIWNYVGYDY